MPTYPSLHNERCTTQDKHVYDAQIVFGTASIASYKAQGMTVERTGTGTFRLTLPMPYLRIQSMSTTWLRGTAGAPYQVHILSTAAIGTTGIITFETVVAAGTVTEPANGAELYLSIGVTQAPINEEYGG